jgi:hypothetical protein
MAKKLTHTSAVKVTTFRNTVLFWFAAVVYETFLVYVTTLFVVLWTHLALTNVAKVVLSTVLRSLRRANLGFYK